MKLTLWRDYGSEGWKPEEFDSEQELADYIKDGGTHTPFRITQEVMLYVGGPDAEKT